MIAREKKSEKEIGQEEKTEEKMERAREEREEREEKKMERAREAREEMEEKEMKEEKKEIAGEKSVERKKREIVVPGETIVSGAEFLPSDYTARQGDNIVALKYGLAEVVGRLVKVIPLSGVYIPRRGNVVIGKVEDITFNGWIVNIAAPYLAFLSAMDAGRYVNKQDITEFLDFGDMIVAEVFAVKHRGIDLTLKARGLGKLNEGMIIKVNSNKVPRVIGKEGSMVNLIKKETGCSITVGQNGLIWIRGMTVEDELLAKEAILFIVEKSFVEGLTQEVEKFLEGRKEK